MLDVDCVRKEFGSVRAVEDVHFRIETGQTFGLIGPNGAGKTTTMRMILGILQPDAGTIRWNGALVDERTRRRFGYLPEERGLYGKMKVRDQIAYFGRLHGLRTIDAIARADRWIERLGVTEYADRPCAELSKGNQQKVQVACACVHEPEFLILDEPFSGLDPVNADVLLAVLGELKAKGTTLVLSSHQMWQLEELCDAFCIIASGTNRADGTLAQLRASWPTRVVRVAPGDDAMRRALESAAGVSVRANADGTLDARVAATTDFSAMLKSLALSTNLQRFEALEPTLHEIYLRAIGAEVAA